ncbi:MAG TPA: glycosyltransferase family 2 protein [Methylomirabilota bacterium]|jgi:glycosyltransferase involved in cell wall biosynthesis|nr:glycosyltransferase family 2 protein [Methylomirabilota bacterium]
MSPPSAPTLSVVIPVYNERRTIEELLWRVQEADVDKELIVVDDGSTDGTAALLRELDDAIRRGVPAVTLPTTGRRLPVANVTILFQPVNRGKGAALRRGFALARGRIVIVQDADLEYDPREYPAMIDPIERGLADVVYGSRFLGGPHRVLLYWHSVANVVLTHISNVFTDLNLTDVWSCYKAFRREIIQSLDLREDRFGFEPEVTARVARLGCRVYEVPISYAGRTYAEGKKIGWKDAISGLRCLLRYSIFT